MNIILTGLLISFLLVDSVLLVIIWFIGWNYGKAKWHWPKHAKSPSGSSYGACLKCGRWDH